ncbi:uncharacterized protein LOC133530527 isoform X2 [Cydia pomonella]|uniref:uncharacterized protein LOC133530527 isoform X2 n=1 Tax=Cydia pomonella TaxID=82600 RepID=UPI002ADD61DF|nr:uncharacterized protein LOC133530527 isoform X2 [Cydia pomonella]
MVHNNNCCVVNCKNTGRNSNCKFYRFPTSSWRFDQRTQWIAAVRRVNTGTDGSPWTPREHDSICSAHFIGGKKSDETASPSYIPTIFSPVNPDTFEPSRGTRICNIHFIGNKKSENPHHPAYIPKIFAGNNEYLTPAPVPKQPELPKDVPTFSMLPALQVVPIEPFIPEEVDNCCMNCAAITDGFLFWCVQCCCGPLCVACAECAPHDGHYLLRTPRGATHSQTQAVLAVIRQQLRTENLLTLYEIDNDGVKVEIKEEPEESSLAEPATEPDPLDPLAPHYPDTGEQVEHDNHYLTKRRRNMPTENNATQPKSLAKLQPKTFNSQTIVKDTPSGLKTVLKPTPIGLKKVLKPIPSGSRPVLKLKRIPSDSILKTTLDSLKRSQNVPKATSSKTRKSQTVLKIIPNDPKPKTLLQVTPNHLEGTQNILNQPSDIKEPQTESQPGKLKIKRTLLKVPLSELTTSKTHQNPSGLKTLRKVKPGEILKLEKIQKILKGTAFQQNDPKGQKLHNVLKGFSTPLKVTSEPPRNSE